MVASVVLKILAKIMVFNSSYTVQHRDFFSYLASLDFHLSMSRASMPTHINIKVSAMNERVAKACLK